MTTIASPPHFTPTDILDYVYAVLHSPSYRQQYSAFLKSDFPRVPYPNTAADFWQKVEVGRELRAYHLLEHPSLGQATFPFKGDGDNRVEKPHFHGEARRIFLNDTQYFEGVEAAAWEFWIGGYQPAQKWLKDRKGRVLEFTEIRHYQQMLAALTATLELMQKV